MFSDCQGQIDWSAAKNDPKCQFAFSQATAGLTVAAETYRGNHDDCAAQGIPFGAYHFSFAKDAGSEQARYFLNSIAGYEGALLPMVDVEPVAFSLALLIVGLKKSDHHGGWLRSFIFASSRVRGRCTVSANCVPDLAHVRLLSRLHESLSKLPLRTHSKKLHTIRKSETPPQDRTLPSPSRSDRFGR
jgi:hypothetical protein